MIIIVDDTFNDRHKFNDVSFLKEGAYKRVCSVKSIIRTIDIEELQMELKDCNMFCYHKTLQLLDVKSNSLNNESNVKLRDNLLTFVNQLNIPSIEFSRGLETKIEARQINKDLFYDNLKVFLDYYIVQEVLEPKILYYGKDFKENEKMTIIQNALIAIRMTAIEDFKNNLDIRKGLNLIYEKKQIETILEQWEIGKIPKNEIINQINAQILK